MFHGYKVQEDGKIWKKDGIGYLSPGMGHKGYPHVNLYYDSRPHTMTVHRVMSLVFMGERPEGHEVNHKNGIRDDNRLCNLEYLTKSQNNQLSYDSGRRNVRGARNANCKITESQVIHVCKILEKGDYKTTVEVAKITGVPKHTVRAIRARRQWVDITSDFNF